MKLVDISPTNVIIIDDANIDHELINDAILTKRINICRVPTSSTNMKNNKNVRLFHGRMSPFKSHFSSSIMAVVLYLVVSQLVLTGVYGSTAALSSATSSTNTKVATPGINSEELEQMFEKMSEDTLKFARHMEMLLLPENKCINLSNCPASSYHGCVSEFPLAQCPGLDYAIADCGTGEAGGCGGLFDFTVSKTRLAPSIKTVLGYESTAVKDAICSTLQAEDYMIQTTEESKAYWESYSVMPPWLYFASDTGVFRMYPGAPDKCINNRSSFDPRIRPWYVAASSGPKDIVLVLDTSGSMGGYNRIEKLKLAATRVIETLGIGDYFTIVEFNDSSRQLGVQNGLLTMATDANKEDALKIIQSLSPSGATNYIAGLQLAYDILSNSGAKEISSICRKAILFVSDGQMTVGTPTQLYSMIDDKHTLFTSRGETPPALFTYSFGASADETIPKELSCRYKGIWSRIGDAEDLAEAMGGYYKYFSYGLGDAVNENFVAWVAPYEYSTGSGMGTTASAPVYDRSVNPPILIGVVGYDFSFAAMQRALGNENSEVSKNAIIDEIVRKSVAYCPLFSLNECQLEALRMYGGSLESGTPDSMCNSCATELPSIRASTCQDSRLNSMNVWNNYNTRSWTYEERTCCDVGENRLAGSLSYEEVQSKVCDVSGNYKFGPIIGGTAGGIFVVIVIGIFWSKGKKKHTPDTQQTMNTPSAPSVYTSNGNGHTFIPIPYPMPPEVPTKKFEDEQYR